MITKQDYAYFIEEQWQKLDILDISDEFLKCIKNNKNKLIEISDNGLIKFVYVGVITFRDEVIVILPKYFNKSFGSELGCIGKLIKVLKKIPKSVITQNEKELFISNNMNNYSEISICDYLIKDFIKNGYYIKKITTSKLNNNSNFLDWKKTINELQPIFSNGSPIYADCYYTHNHNNTDEFITKIHKAVIDYSIAKYAELLGYKFKVDCNIARKNLLRLGNMNKIIMELENELSNVFNDRDIMLIKSLLNFFYKQQDSSNNKLFLYGTTNFELIWEYICGYIFDNEYESLNKQIDKILWRSIEGECVTNDSNLLKPDILIVVNRKLLVLDAKYYSITLTNKLVKGNPGSYDIIKQFAYGLAFKDKGYKRIISCLLYPKELNNFDEVFGSVNLEFFGQDPIVNIYLSPHQLYDRFLFNNKLTEKELNEFLNKVEIYIEKDIEERKLK